MMTLANRLALLILLLLLSCSSPEKDLVTIKGNTMGTTYTIKFFPKTNNPVEIEKNYVLVEDILRNINQDVRFHVELNSGHWIMYETPDIFNTIISNILE